MGPFGFVCKNRGRLSTHKNKHWEFLGRCRSFTKAPPGERWGNETDEGMDVWVRYTEGFTGSPGGFRDRRLRGSHVLRWEEDAAVLVSACLIKKIIKNRSCR